MRLAPQLAPTSVVPPKPCVKQKAHKNEPASKANIQPQETTRPSPHQAKVVEQPKAGGEAGEDANLSAQRQVVRPHIVIKQLPDKQHLRALIDPQTISRPQTGLEHAHGSARRLHFVHNTGARQKTALGRCVHEARLEIDAETVANALGQYRNLLHVVWALGMKAQHHTADARIIGDREHVVAVVAGAQQNEASEWLSLID